jgi:hypothetical protein
VHDAGDALHDGASEAGIAELRRPGVDVMDKFRP